VISIRQITPVFAGEVSGVDITRPLSGEEVAAIEAAWIATPCWCSTISA
jgi:hypothetical protein